MNQENTELFFGDEQDVVITLEVEDGTETKVTPLASFEIDELGTEYIIAADNSRSIQLHHDAFGKKLHAK